MIESFPLEAKVRDIKYYYEMGDVLKVEVLDAKRRNYGSDRGVFYKLKVLEVVRDNTRANNRVGGEFEVWKSLSSGGQSGWYLRDSLQ